MRIKTLILFTCLLASSFILAQEKPTKSAGAPDKAFIQKILDAWSTMNTDNVSK